MVRQICGDFKMNALFLSARVLHVLLGAAWLGGVILLSFFLTPALQEVGPDAGKVVVALMGRRLDAYLASLAGLTVLTGLYVYWTITGGFDPEASSTLRAKVIGLGGVLGLVAAVIGGSVVARNMKKSVALMQQAGAADAAARSALMAQAAQCRQKAATGGRIVAVLVILTATLMAIGAHFV
jgi:uncharacterized membrane protein